MILLLPLYPPPSPVSKLDLRMRDNLVKGEGVGEEEGAKSHDKEKAWSSIVH
jgi:hypothetical protein